MQTFRMGLFLLGGVIPRGIAAPEEIYGEGFKMKGSGILLYIPVLFGDIR